MPERFDRRAARYLTLRYALALAAVAVLTVAAQAVVQVALARQANDAAVVNLAGRQRMLSQKLSKAAIAWRDADPPGRERRAVEVRTALAEWTRAHARLSRGGDLAGAGIHNSAMVAAHLAELDPVVGEMADAATRLTGDPGAVERILAAEAVFLPRMEAIVGLYGAEAAARVAWTRRLEFGLCLVLLLVLALEVVLVFGPAVRGLRRLIHDQERLREREALDRELAAAVQTARDIGQDLHDGLGQTLTALSFHARRLELDLAGEQRAEAQAVSTGISEAIAQVRALGRRLAPIDVQVAGLEGALRELADATARAAGVSCSLAWEPGLQVSAVAAEDLYRIAQEAITNTLRHGHARTLELRCQRASGSVQLSIVDDGTVGTVPLREGVGTRAMRARAVRLGGSLSLGPQPGGGWRVAVAVPA